MKQTSKFSSKFYGAVAGIAIAAAGAMIVQQAIAGVPNAGTSPVFNPYRIVIAPDPTTGGGDSLRPVSDAVSIVPVRPPPRSTIR